MTILPLCLLLSPHSHSHPKGPKPFSCHNWQETTRSDAPNYSGIVKFSSISWTHDNKGFFYSRYPAPQEGGKLDAGTETNANLNHELYYHFLGTDQSADILCWKVSDSPTCMRSALLSEDGKYLQLDMYEGAVPVNKFYCCDISALPNGLEGYQGKGLLPFVKVVDNFDAKYEAIANDDTVFTFLTNKDAPKYKLVRVDLKEPSTWTEVIQEAESDVLESVVPVYGNQIIVSYLSDCKQVLQLRDFKSGILQHQLPIDIGSVNQICAMRKDNMFFIRFNSFLTPGVIYVCNLESGVPEMRMFREMLVPGFDRTQYHADQVFVSSKDGTRIPMFIVARKDILMDRSHPCLLYAYGGFGSSITPSFSISRIVLARHLGAVFCEANIRGGGEYGKEWHKAGSLSKKQNCFDDFISAAEYLVCTGHAWVSEFGSSDKEEEFHWLIKYSPVHNVKRPWENFSAAASQYPPTMLLTADHDDRVVPLHSLKLLATMQYVLCTSLEQSPQTNPMVARIDCKAGHGCGHPTQKVIDACADRYSFMAKMLGASWIH